MLHDSVGCFLPLVNEKLVKVSNWLYIRERNSLKMARSLKEEETPIDIAAHWR